jgi:hypothetical protein
MADIGELTSKGQNLTNGQILTIVALSFKKGEMGNYVIITSKEDGKNVDYFTSSQPVIKKLRAIEQDVLEKTGKEFDWKTGVTCRVSQRVSEAGRTYFQLVSAASEEPVA